MTIVGITGANGFFGWHLRCRLFTHGWKFVAADRKTFANPALLEEFLNQADVVVHLAGVNRASSEAEVRDGNIDLAQTLVDARSRTGAAFDLIYSNSTKSSEAGPYGEAKLRASEILKESTEQAGGRFVDIRFPHLYGEFGKPNYNSAISTFANQLANGEVSSVGDGKLELLHIQDACQVIIDAIEGSTAHAIQPSGRKISVVDAYEKLSRLAEPYVRNGTLPYIAEDQFELRLFNAVRSQMWPSQYPMKLTKHADQRGAFFEVVRAWGQGQTSISTTVPGVTRGEHYHLDKIERFAVISGTARIRVRRLMTADVECFEVTGDDPVFIDMPPLCTHDITNTGTTELVTMFWSHDHFDPDNADTYPLAVVGEDLPA